MPSFMFHPQRTRTRTERVYTAAETGHTSPTAEPYAGSAEQARWLFFVQVEMLTHFKHFSISMKNVQSGCRDHTRIQASSSQKALSNENFSAGWMQLVTVLESSQHNEWIEAGTKH